MFIALLPEAIVNNFVVQILLAAVLGASIGLEREMRGRSAGLRTNMLVCVGSAVFMILSVAIAQSYAGAGDIILRADPTRIAAQVVTGIGFLGAGAIIKFGFSIRGLTTAACLWITSAIGMSCGSGYFDVAVLTTLIAIFALTILNRVEKLHSKDTYRTLRIVAHNDTDVSRLIEAVKSDKIDVLHFDEEKCFENNRLTLTLALRLHRKDMMDDICHDVFDKLEAADVELYKIIWEHQ